MKTYSKAEMSFKTRRQYSAENVKPICLRMDDDGI